MKKSMILAVLLIFISGSVAIAKVQTDPPAQSKKVLWFGKCSKENNKQKHFHKKFTKKAQHKILWQRKNH